MKVYVNRKIKTKTESIAVMKTYRNVDAACVKQGLVTTID